MLIPQPKQSSLTLERREYPPHLLCGSAEFSAAADRFCEYAHKAHMLSFAPGEGGVTVEKDAALGMGRYRLLNGETVCLQAGDIQGAHDGFASLLQLIRPERSGFSCPQGRLEDWPDAPYRGLMVDLARQWHPFELLLQYVDLCYFYKVNKLQLHFTDEQSFTLPMTAYPALSTPGRSYTREEIDRLVDYAWERGVELIPEVDMPGHCGPFQRAYPGLFGNTGVLPADETVFEALNTVLAEVCGMFPHSPYIHVGGDEASVENWKNCQRTQRYMQRRGMTDMQELYADYIRQITDQVLALGRTPIVWEGFHKEYNYLISKKVLVVAWESYYQPAYDLAADGFTLINGSWKPLYIVTPHTHWTREEILGWHPYNWQHWFEKSAAYPDGYTLDKACCTVLGGQLCAWGDHMKNAENPMEDCRQELALIEERLPALAEAVWNVGPRDSRPAAEVFRQAERTAAALRIHGV